LGRWEIGDEEGFHFQHIPSAHLELRASAHLQTSTSTNLHLHIYGKNISICSVKKFNMTKVIIWDLGGVLIDWNPKYLFRKIFDDEASMNSFLERVCTADWNEEQDAGRALKEATETLVAQFPGEEENIRAYYSRWEEMLAGDIKGAVDIFRQLKENGQYKQYALTNWSAELFPVAQQKFEFLKWFDGVVVSGAEKMRKPTAAFYQLLLERYNVAASEAVFIDDNLRNVKAARQLGIDSIQFTSPKNLKEELLKRGIQI
jgi:2-haloacid dehalogenase